MPVELSQDQIAELRNLEGLHDEIRKELERAKTAGLDVSAMEANLDQLEATRQGLLKVYGGMRRQKRS